MITNTSINAFGMLITATYEPFTEPSDNYIMVINFLEVADTNEFSLVSTPLNGGLPVAAMDLFCRHLKNYYANNPDKIYRGRVGVSIASKEQECDNG